jgi:glycosyltransferase involved in cell wall biosynthesis
LLRAIEKLDKRDDLLLVIALYSAGDIEYLRMLERIRDGMHNCVFVHDLEPDAFNALLAKTHIYVRPTYVDGDSVAVREALANGCRVVASDCIDRPHGVDTFKSGCDDSLRDCLQRVLSLHTDTRSHVEQQRDFAQDVMSVYKKLVENKQWS